MSTQPMPVILNVDDNEIGRYAKTRALQRAGYAVTDAATGSEALRLVEETKPDLVLLDVKLPDMSGIEVCSLIKKSHPRIAVLQISATFTDKGARIRGLDAGADSYVTQPIEADELAANVRALLRMRAAEDELRRLNETLEERVAQRTAELDAAVEQLKVEAKQRELAEAALRQSQKMEAIGQLTGGVAHDFNNLLTIIRASTDLLRRDGLTEERRVKYVDAISDTADRAAVLTGQLLSFARRQALAPKVFDAREQVQSIATMLQTIMGSRVTIDTDLECDACFVLADPSQFETALINLAVNARDAMSDEGTLTLLIRHVENMPSAEANGAAGDSYVSVAISDTGIGIAQAALGKIFEPFYTTKDVGKGTGLGLSQVYGFARQSGGDIFVESSVGEGTTFTLFLPLAEKPASQAEEARPIPTASIGGHILIVEDNAEVGDVARQLLIDLGFETTLVDSADKALAILAAPAPAFDMIFTDVVMPGMTGIELAQAVRAKGITIPIVLTSGYSHVLASQGSDGLILLKKPYSREGLARALDLGSRQ